VPRVVLERTRVVTPIAKRPILHDRVRRSTHVYSKKGKRLEELAPKNEALMNLLNTYDATRASTPPSVMASYVSLNADMNAKLMDDLMEHVSIYVRNGRDNPFSDPLFLRRRAHSAAHPRA
jgi:hypothetical protein